MWEEWIRSREKVRPEAIGALLFQLSEDIREDSSRIELAATRLSESVRSVRMLPFSTIFNMFPKMLRDIARAQQKEVQIVFQG